MITALDDVSLDLYPSDLVVLLGASGSGKSTLLNILGGLDAPTNGSVMFHDKDIAKATENERTAFRRHYIGFIFQFYNLIPSLTARENVSVVTEIADNPLQPEEALAMVGLEARMDHFPSEMSGGEQKKDLLSGRDDAVVDQTMERGDHRGAFEAGRDTEAATVGESGEDFLLADGHRGALRFPDGA